MNKPKPYDEKKHFADFLCNHPDEVYETFDGTLWKYESSSGNFLWCKPTNKVRNGWYVAGGLTQSYHRSNK